MIDLGQVKYFVMDEADRMLADGFDVRSTWLMDQFHFGLVGDVCAQWDILYTKRVCETRRFTCRKTRMSHTNQVMGPIAMFCLFVGLYTKYIPQA